MEEDEENKENKDDNENKENKDDSVADMEGGADKDDECDDAKKSGSDSRYTEYLLS